MGRRFESCRAHHNSPVFTRGSGVFPFLPCSPRFPIVPIFVPTRTCCQCLGLAAQGGESPINRIRVRMYVPHAHLNRAMARNPHEGPNVAARCTEPGEESVPKGVQHERLNLGI